MEMREIRILKRQQKMSRSLKFSKLASMVGVIPKGVEAFFWETQDIGVPAGFEANQSFASLA